VASLMPVRSDELRAFAVACPQHDRYSLLKRSASHARTIIDVGVCSVTAVASLKLCVLTIVLIHRDVSAV
jgi:hypothetical protein